MVPSGLARVERWYPVVGSTALDIARCIAKLGPERDGRRFGAYTDWTVTWRYAMSLEGGAASIAKVEVIGEAVVTLPRFIPLRSTSEALRAEFARYLSALAEHERGHVELAARVRADVSEALRALGEHPDAPALEAAVAAAAARAIGRGREFERAYDEATRCGATQGAAWTLPA